MESSVGDFMLASENNDGLHNIRPLSPLYVNISDQPSWTISILLALQNCILVVGPAFCVIISLKSALCVSPGDPIFGPLVSSLILVSAIGAVLQTYVGLRLPIVMSFNLVHLNLILKQPKDNCMSLSHADIYSMGEKRSILWESQIRELQGSLIVFGFVQILIGYSGILSLLMKIVTPISVAPTIVVIGLTLAKKAANFKEDNYFITILTIIVLVIFSQSLRMKVSIPIYSLSRGWRFIKQPFFQYFSILLTMFILILVYYTVKKFTDDFIDLKMKDRLKIIEDTSWYISYPFSYGWPIFEPRSFLTLLSTIVLHIFVSIADYHACAKIYGVVIPPKSVIGRAFGVEGITNLLSGIVGCGLGLTTSSESIGLVGVTKVGCRRVVLISAIILVVSSIWIKMMVFLYVPSSVEAGILCFLTFIYSGSGVSLVKFDNYRSIFIFGAALFFGLVTEDIHMQNFESYWQEIFSFVIFHPSFISTATAVILDNIIPKEKESLIESNDRKTYKVPNICQICWIFNKNNT